VQAIRQEAHEQVRLNASLVLVKDRPDRQVALEVAKGLLHLHQLQMVIPHHSRVCLGQIAAQQVPALSATKPKTSAPKKIQTDAESAKSG